MDTTNWKDISDTPTININHTLPGVALTPGRFIENGPFALQAVAYLSSRFHDELLHLMNRDKIRNFMLPLLRDKKLIMAETHFMHRLHVSRIGKLPRDSTELWCTLVLASLATIKNKDTVLRVDRSILQVQTLIHTRRADTHVRWTGRLKLALVRLYLAKHDLDTARNVIIDCYASVRSEFGPGSFEYEEARSLALRVKKAFKTRKASKATEAQK